MRTGIDLEISMKTESAMKLISAKEAAALIGVSVSTFRKMRNMGVFASSEVRVGQRLKYSKDKLLESFKFETLKAPSISNLKLCIFSDGNFFNYYSDNIIDLTKLTLVDPFGSLRLLIFLIERLTFYL